MGVLLKKLATIPIYAERPSDSNGFTIIEVVVALAIITIALTSVYRMQSQTFRMSADARFYTIAPMLAESKLAEIESQGIENATDGSGDFNDDYPGFSWSVSMEDLQSDLLKEKKQHLTRINVTISQDETLTYELRTYRFHVE